MSILGSGDGELVLVVDDDPDIRTFLEVTLTLHNFRVVLGENGEEALELAVKYSPAIILMDVMMPRKDGLEALNELREDGRISHLPVIMLTAKAQAIDKIEGFSSGADDYVTKPFDPRELLARIRATLRRAREMRSVSSLTGLPGNPRIEKEIARRVDQGTIFALLYADLNQFKGYNDHYGFLRGDEVLTAAARLALQVAGDVGDGRTFVGHVGGDDFVMLTAIEQYENVVDEYCRRFDAIAPTFYDDEDRERGFIDTVDRQGNPVSLPLMSVSIGVAHNRDRGFAHHGEPVSIATEMKSFAKNANTGPSNWAVDRRHKEVPEKAPSADVEPDDAQPQAPVGS